MYYVYVKSIRKTNKIFEVKFNLIYFGNKFSVGKKYTDI